MSSWLVRKRRVIICIGQKEAVRELVWDHCRLVIVCELKHVPEDLENKELAWVIIRRG
jgi:hypothetical protein